MNPFLGSTISARPLRRYNTPYSTAVMNWPTMSFLDLAKDQKHKLLSPKLFVFPRQYFLTWLRLGARTIAVGAVSTQTTEALCTLFAALHRPIRANNHRRCCQGGCPSHSTARCLNFFADYATESRTLRKRSPSTTSMTGGRELYRRGAQCSGATRYQYHTVT